MFRIRYDHYEYKVMPLGLSNALTNFQGYINKMLAKKLNVFVNNYQDNILIYINEANHVNFIL